MSQTAAEPQLTIQRGGRERFPYKLNPVISRLRDDGHEIDASIERGITKLYLALCDGNVSEAEAYAVLGDLLAAAKTSKQHTNTLDLLDISGSEAALNAVERRDRQRREGDK